MLKANKLIKAFQCASPDLSVAISYRLSSAFHCAPCDTSLDLSVAISFRLSSEFHCARCDTSLDLSVAISFRLDYHLNFIVREVTLLCQFERIKKTFRQIANQSSTQWLSGADSRYFFNNRNFLYFISLTNQIHHLKTFHHFSKTSMVSV